MSHYFNPRPSPGLSSGPALALAGRMSWSELPPELCHSILDHLDLPGEPILWFGFVSIHQIFVRSGGGGQGEHYLGDQLWPCPAGQAEEEGGGAGGGGGEEEEKWGGAGQEEA